MIPARLAPHAPGASTPYTVAHLAMDGDTSGYFPSLARWHDRERYRMFFLTLRPMDESLRAYVESQDVECFSCGCRSRVEYPIGLLRLVRFLRQRRVHLLHTHLFDPSVVGLIGAWVARTPVRTMTRHYSDYHTRINRPWHVRLDRLCTALCHRVIAASEHTVQVMRDEEGAPADRVQVILYGVNFDRLRLTSPEAPQTLKREFAPDGEFLLLHVARMHPEKGHEFLFRALPAILQHAGRPVRLVLAGTGSFESAYRRRVRELGLEQAVTFAGFRRDIPDLIAAADLLLLPSVAESFGMVLVEALYLGTPVVASRIGGIPEIVQDGVDGLLVPAGDPDALASAVVTLIQDNHLRCRLAGAGREKVIGRFGFERMMRQYEALYDDMLSEPGRGNEATRLHHHPFV